MYDISSCILCPFYAKNVLICDFIQEMSCCAVEIAPFRHLYFTQKTQKGYGFLASEEIVIMT